MKYTLTVTSSETGVKDGVRRTITHASTPDYPESEGKEGCQVTFVGGDDLLFPLGAQLELTAFPVRKAREGREGREGREPARNAEQVKSDAPKA